MNPESCSKLNPWCIPELRLKLFNFMNVDDLKNCRLVNKTWNGEVCEILRRKIKTIEFTSSMAVLRFIKAFRSYSQEIVFQSFSLWFEVNLKESHVEQFFQIFDSSIQELNLGWPAIPWSRIVRDYKHNIRKILQTYCYHLHTLSVVADCTMTHEGGWKEIKTPLFGNGDFVIPSVRTLHLLSSSWDPKTHFILDLMKVMPNLENLKFSYLSYSQENVTFIDMLEAAYAGGGLRNLKSLEIETIKILHTNLVSEKEFSKLLNVNFQLERFTCSIKMEYPHEYLYEFLNRNSLTLRKLNLRVEPKDSMIRLPSMPRVTDLTLNYYHMNREILVLFPSLKHLELLKYHPYASNELENFTIVLAANSVPGAFSRVSYNTSTSNSEPRKGSSMQLASLKMPYRYFQEILMFSQVFPGLKKLELGANDLILKTVYREMKQLEELIIWTGFNLTNNGFIGNGISFLGFHKVNNGANYAPEILEQLFCSPFIGYLTNLRHLAINLEKPCQISDLSIVFGVASLRKLCTVYLSRGLDLSSRSIDALSQMPNISRICLQTPAIVATEYLEDLKVEQPDLDIVLQSSTKMELQQIGVFWTYKRILIPREGETKPSENGSSEKRSKCSTM